MKNNFQIDMSRIEELESKEYLTPEEFRELGHFRMSQLLSNVTTDTTKSSMLIKINIF